MNGFVCLFVVFGYWRIVATCWNDNQKYETG